MNVIPLLSKPNTNEVTLFGKAKMTLKMPLASWFLVLLFDHLML